MAKNSTWSSKERRNLVLDILTGHENIEDAASKHNLAMTEIETWKDFYLQTLREGAKNTSRPFSAGTKKRIAISGVATLLLLVVLGFSSGVIAATGDCPNDLPFCFLANTPARASDINHNFSAIVEWIEQKVGTVGTADVRIATTGIKPFEVTGGIGASSDGVEFLHSNRTQGIGLGYNTIYPAGTASDQNLNLVAKGTGKVTLAGEIMVNSKAFGGITIETQQQAEQTGVGDKGTLLGKDDGRRICFLTYQYAWNGDYGGDSAYYNTCEVYSNGTNLYVYAHTSSGGDAWANTRCRARCISW